MENLFTDAQIHEHTLSYAEDFQYTRFAIHATFHGMQHCPNGIFNER